MTTELPKAYDPKSVEKEIYDRWNAAGAFNAEADGAGEKFCIVIPPPNVTAALHLGHALNNTLQDVLIRWRRMQGYNALWMPGTDHAGIATQTVVDKRMLAEGQGGLAKYRDLEAKGQGGREQFIAKVQAWKDEYEATILNQLKLMGCSCDWRRTRFTMDEVCAKAVRAAFFKLFSDGLIYRGKRLVNWDPATQTVLADDEVEHEEVKGHFWYLKYPLVPRGEGESAAASSVAGILPARAEGVSPSVASSSSSSSSASSGQSVPPPVEGGIEKRTGRYLPHWSRVGSTYAVTFRLADSVPREVSEAWKIEREEIVGRAQKQGRPLTHDERRELNALHSAKVESYLDAGYGSCALRDERAAKVVQDALLHFDDQRYDLVAWAVMPNHVHVVFRPLPEHELQDILRSWKSYTAKEVNRLLNRQGQFWMGEYYDHLIRDEQDFFQQVTYAINNPEKAGLTDWTWKGMKKQKEEGEEERGQDALGTRGRDARDTRGQDVRDTITYVTVATTRPETMLGDTAVAMNPRDPRAAALIGRKVRLPIVGREIPIIADEHVVLPDPNSDDEKARFSTGFLKVTPAHDPEDYAIRERCVARGEPIDIINVLALDGTISEKFGWTDWEKVSKNADGSDNSDLQALIGLDRFKARKKIEQWFDQKGLLEKKVDYVHQVGHSYRSHVPIEPYLSDQWYVAVKKSIPGIEAAMANCRLKDDQVEKKNGAMYLKGTDVPVDSLAGLALMPLLDGRLKFVPDRYANNYRTWLENLRDWPISRQLWWGHQIPVWHVSLRYSKVWEPGGGNRDGWTPEACYADFEKALQEFATAAEINGEYCLIPDPRMPGTVVFICSKTPHADSRLQHLKEVFKNWDPAELISSGQTRLTLNSQEDIKAFVLANKIISIEQDPDVLDTWFSSALWPFSTLGWPKETPELKTFYPGDVLCTAREIITLWVSRMVMMGQYCCGDIPFHDVFIHAMIQDGEGRKMSKSLGNGIDPLEIIDSHGADAMRFTLVSMTTQTQDVRLPVAKMKLPDGRDLNSSPKFDVGRNFCNKLWNASRFAMMNLRPCPPWGEVRPSTSLADRWILSRLNATIRDATTALEEYRFNELGDTLYHFMWDDFCDWYLEIAKGRINAGEGQPRAIVAHCLDVILRLLHPIAPFITEAIWANLNQVAPARGPAAEMAEPMLIRAAWPRADARSIDSKAEADFTAIQDLIRQVRNVRTQHNVPPSKQLKVQAHVEAGQERLAALIRENADLFTSQANLEELTVFQEKKQEEAEEARGQDARGTRGQDVRDTQGQDAHATESTAPADAAAIAVSGVKLYVLGAVDKAAELTRLTKQRDTLAKGIGAIEAKLASAGFVAKAPPAVVEKERKRLEGLQAELSAVEKSLAALNI